LAYFFAFSCFAKLSTKNIRPEINKMKNNVFKIAPKYYKNVIKMF